MTNVMQWLVTSAVHPITLVAIGSAVGGNLRYWLGRWIENQQWPGGLPWGTLLVNIIGSLLLGFVGTLLLERLEPSSRQWYLLLGTGFCGGFTTFSTFEWETYKLLRDGAWPAALAYVAGSVLLAFAALLAGVMLATWLLPRR